MNAYEEDKREAQPVAPEPAEPIVLPEGWGSTFGGPKPPEAEGAPITIPEVIAALDRVGRVDRVDAPWDARTVEILNEHQRNPQYHPYTCGSGNRKDADHLDGEGVLIATKWGWLCPFCDYKQGWAHVPTNPPGSGHEIDAFLHHIDEIDKLFPRLMSEIKISNAARLDLVALKHRIREQVEHLRKTADSIRADTAKPNTVTKTELAWTYDTLANAVARLDAAPVVGKIGEEPRKTTAPPAVHPSGTLLGEAKLLLTLIDDVPIDARLGDETDRVFPRYEFEGLRAAVAAEEARLDGTGQSRDSVPRVRGPGDEGFGYMPGDPGVPSREALRGCHQPPMAITRNRFGHKPEFAYANGEVPEHRFEAASLVCFCKAAEREPTCTCGADRTGPSAESHKDDCPAAAPHEVTAYCGEGEDKTPHRFKAGAVKCWCGLTNARIV